MTKETTIEQELVALLHDKHAEQAYERLGELLERYFRLSLHGTQHIPTKGRAIIAPNHSGFSGLDALVLRHCIRKRVHRTPRILAHRAYFDPWQLLAAISLSFGLERAKIKSGREQLERDKLLLLFPEAEAGNFKSSLRRYQLQPFHSGVVRLSLATGAPVVPTLVLGAEETSLSWGNIDLTRWFKHIRVPLPINPLPLPAKWDIHFLPPRHFDGKKPVDRQTAELQHEMQEALGALLRGRRYIFASWLF